MSRIALVRTTAFRLTDEHFGKVYVYRPGERFTRVWQGLEQSWRRNGDQSEFTRLPYRGLATALRVLTGDFIALERRIGSGKAFVVSRKFISPADLRTAIGSWEARALGMPGGPVSRALDDLRTEEVRVADHVLRRTRLCPNINEGWVWDVGVWESAHRLAQSGMRTDKGAIGWRLDSDAALLSWDDTIVFPKSDASAIHKLTLHLITVPGVEDPVLSIQASLVRLAPTWKATGGARYAWAELDDAAPLLRGRVRTKRDGNGGFVTDWDDRAAEVLGGASLEPLPRITGEPDPSGPVRTGYAKQPRTHRLGRGVGPWFHECVAHHARNALGASAPPVDLAIRKVPSGIKQKSARLVLGVDSPGSKAELRILVVYAGSGTRRRVREALGHVLVDGAHERDVAALEEVRDRLRTIDDEGVLPAGPLELCFLKPTRANDFLLGRNAIEQWADSWLPMDVPQGVRLAAIIETDVGVSDKPKAKDGLADPKQVLRRHLASKGVATQFITASSAPNSRKGKASPDPAKFREHAAANAVGDLLRSTGYFLRPFPEFGGGEGTIVVGVYGARLTKNTTGRRTSYVANLIAVSLGSGDAWGYVDGQGWEPIHSATTRFLASDQQRNTEHEAKALVERAIDSLYGRFGDRRVILLFDAFGCRRFWPCLTDKFDGRPESWMSRNGKAVVRVRTATSEVVRPAGTGEWSDELRPAKHTDFRLMAVNDGEGCSPTYVISGSAVMSREIGARRSTRFAASPADLRKDWHSLGVTELQVLDPGSWEPEDLLRQVAILCRVAPTWDRTLRWPSPLHLARAVVRDHPHGYFSEGEEDEDIEDSKQMRFDFGIYS